MYQTLGMLVGSGAGGGGAAAFPTLVSHSHDGSPGGAGVNRTCALPGGIVAGQIIVLAVSLAPGSVTVAVPSGFARVSGEDVFSKVAVGGETSVTYVLSGSSLASNVSALVFDSGSLIEAASFEATPGTNANPPSLTVSWGAANNLFMALYHKTGIGSGVSNYPSNCPLYRSIDTTPDDEGVAGAESLLATFDPATFTTGSGNYNTFTIGLRG